MRASPLLGLAALALGFAPLEGQELTHLLTLPVDGTALGEVGDVDVTGGGEIVVMDTQADLVYLFNADGALLRTLGGEGEGPGEIMLSVEVEVGPDGSIVVADGQNRRLTMWGPDGAMTGDAAFESLFGAGFHWPHDLVWNETGLYLKVSQFTPGSPLHVFRIPTALDGVADTVLTFASDEDAPDCTFCAMTVDGRGRVLSVAGDTLYRVSALDRDGRAVASWVRTEVAAVRRSAEEIDRITQRTARMRGIEGGGSSAPEVSPFKTRFGPHAVGYDGSGRLWTAPRMADEEPGVFDIFSPAGGFLRRIALDHPFEGFRLRGDHVVVAGLTPIGEPVVHLYRIDR